MNENCFRLALGAIRPSIELGQSVWIDKWEGAVLEKGAVDIVPVALVRNDRRGRLHAAGEG